MHPAPPTSAVTVQLGRKLFSFRSFVEWSAKAHSWFGAEGYQPGETICIDQRGQICRNGKHFALAERYGAYPIDVYALRDDAEVDAAAANRAAQRAAKIRGDVVPGPEEVVL